MKTLILTISAVLITVSTFAFSPNNEGKTVRYKGVFYTVVYEGSNYSVLINTTTGDRKIVDFKK